MSTITISRVTFHNACTALRHDDSWGTIESIETHFERKYNATVCNSSGVYGFNIKFDTEEDATMFLLRWA